MEGRGRNSVAGIATPFELQRRRSNPGWGEHFRPFETVPRSYSTTCTIGTGSFPGINRPGSGGEHPLLLATKLKEKKSFVAFSSVKFTYVEFVGIQWD